MEIYSSGIISESFWSSEVKQVLRLLQDGHTWEMIKEESIQNNLFGVSKEYRNYRIYGYIRRRIEQMDELTRRLMMSTDHEFQRLVNLVAIAMQYRSFYEFIYDVYQEKISGNT